LFFIILNPQLFSECAKLVDNTLDRNRNIVVSGFFRAETAKVGGNALICTNQFKEISQ
jgi:hypothetical protein